MLSMSDLALFYPPLPQQTTVEAIAGRAVGDVVGDRWAITWVIRMTGKERLGRATNSFRIREVVFEACLQVAEQGLLGSERSCGFLSHPASQWQDPESLSRSRRPFGSGEVLC
jgi:hypothetical protein